MIKFQDILNESPESDYPPYMFSPVGFGCHVCKYYYVEWKNEIDGKHMCSNKYYQEYIAEQFPQLENPAELVDNEGNPIKDPSKWCSNWFMPKGK
jgi:hypothetical protein